jgi:alpha-ribazole phosphatase/probable phosphoglycerate mutase
MNRLVLIRHAEPDDSMRGRSYGRLDVPLSTAGRAQAAAITETLRDARLDAVFASPLRRAIDTAAPLAEARGLEVVTHDGLQELDFGALEGLTFDDIALERPELYETWMRDPTQPRFPNGESFDDLRERALAAAAEIRSEHERAAIVAHGGVTRAILADALQMPARAIFRLDQPYGAISIVEWTDGTAVVRGVNLLAEPA